ncbi:non-specific lipid-transfer protein 1-like [Ananas comosus]|uniref:Non-specific lipid-transfer protein n=2 Tax=Ananas comosus TaxID=4615 RepID=A0A6P5F120_ANACO|nr:non-specific lipid-transfer protein 1-like [Ananas comosus]
MITPTHKPFISPSNTLQINQSHNHMAAAAAAASRRASLAASFLLLLLLAAPLRGAEAITCADVISYVGPCVTYITGGEISQACCSGAKELRDVASTTAVRRQICSCLKSEASSYSGLTVDAFDKIVAQCGVSLPYKIGADPNCSVLN